MKANSETAKIRFLVTYETINIPDLLDSHQSRASLIQALSTRDDYYRRVAETAVELNTKSKALSDENTSLTGNIDLLKRENELLRDNVSSLKKENNDLLSKLLKLKNVLENNVYAGIACVVLQKEGILPYGDLVIESAIVQENMINPSTDIIDFTSINNEETAPYEGRKQRDFESPVISSMLDPFC